MERVECMTWTWEASRYRIRDHSRSPLCLGMAGVVDGSRDGDQSRGDRMCEVLKT